MATKSTTADKAENANTKKKIDLDNLNLDAKVTVTNLAGWWVTFARLHDGIGDIVITKDGQQRLSRNEIQAQINSGNKLFCGVDGQGSHATLYIEDEATRRLVGFEDEGRKQVVFTYDMVKELFAMGDADFKNELSKRIVTRAEKYALVEAIKKLDINDYKKVVFALDYTGYKI